MPFIIKTIKKQDCVFYFFHNGSKYTKNTVGHCRKMSTSFSGLVWRCRDKTTPQKKTKTFIDIVK